MESATKNITLDDAYVDYDWFLESAVLSNMRSNLSSYPEAKSVYHQLAIL